MIFTFVKGSHMVLSRYQPSSEIIGVAQSVTNFSDGHSQAFVRRSVRPNVDRNGIVFWRIDPSLAFLASWPDHINGTDIVILVVGDQRQRMRVTPLAYR